MRSEYLLFLTCAITISALLICLIFKSPLTYMIRQYQRASDFCTSSVFPLCCYVPCFAYTASITENWPHLNVFLTVLFIISWLKWRCDSMAVPSNNNSNDSVRIWTNFAYIGCTGFTKQFGSHGVSLGVCVWTCCTSISVCISGDLYTWTYVWLVHADIRWMVPVGFR